MRFHRLRIGRKHIDGYNIRLTIVIVIGNIIAHAKSRIVSKMFRPAFRESTVAVIYIVIIVLVKIVADVDVIKAIVVQIRNRNAQSISEVALVNARLCRDVGKLSGSAYIISGQPVTGITIEPSAPAGIGDVLIGMVRLIQDETIQIAIVIIIEENGLCRKGAQIQSVFLGTLGKSPVTVVNE